MGITLSIVSGATAGRKMRLSTGQTARFGRTEWADYSFPNDSSMSDVHFIVECNHDYSLIRDLGSESGTFVGDTQITEVRLRTSDQIKAGETVFAVVIDGEAAPIRTNSATVTSDSVDTLSTSTVPAPPPTLVEICEYIKLDATALELANGRTIAPLEFVAVLVNERQFMPALRLMAHHFQRREAVWWGALCTRESVGSALSQKDLAALDAAEQWVKTGEEADRRKAHDAAELTKYETAAGWVAEAAFWADGSLAPVGFDDVISDERLTGQAITGALLMAAVQVSPLKAQANYARYLAIAQDVLSGKLAAPKKK